MTLAWSDPGPDRRWRSPTPDPTDKQKQFDACGSKDKTFRVYTAEEGGAQHCQRDYLTLVVAEMWNWFEDKLLRA